MFVCTRCGTTRSDATSCPDHVDAPMLDASDPRVRRWLVDNEDAHVARRRSWATTLGVGAGIMLSYLLIHLAHDVPGWAGVALDLGPIAVGIGLSHLWAQRRYTNRFAHLTA